MAIGVDRNGPSFERWQSAQTEWWAEDPAHIFDEVASHQCRDVLDRWYASNPDALRKAMRYRDAIEAGSDHGLVEATISF